MTISSPRFSRINKADKPSMRAESKGKPDNLLFLRKLLLQIGRVALCDLVAANHGHGSLRLLTRFLSNTFLQGGKCLCWNLSLVYLLDRCELTQGMACCCSWHFQLFASSSETFWCVGSNNVLVWDDLLADDGKNFCSSLGRARCSSHRSAVGQRKESCLLPFPTDSHQETTSVNLRLCRRLLVCLLRSGSFAGSFCLCRRLPLVNRFLLRRCAAGIYLQNTRCEVEFHVFWSSAQAVTKRIIL